MFNHIEQGRRLKKDDQLPGNIPFVMSGTTNQGVVGYISNPVASFPANSITIDIFGNTFYRSYAFGAGDDTGVYWSDEVQYSEASLLFIAATIEKSLHGKFDFGNKLRSSQSFDFIVKLPQTNDGEIDFVFIDSFVRELERARLRELEAYLKATGLDDYELTDKDKATLSNYKNVQWKEFNVKDLFGASTRGKRLKSEDRIPGTLPFVTAGEADTGISAFIGNPVTVFAANTTTIDMFGSAKYRTYEYGADDHVAVVHTESLPQHAAIFVTSACHKAAHTGKFDYGHNFYAKDADELNIMLPTIDGENPDFAIMEQLIAAIQKIVIADVAKYTARNLDATQQVIESQEEPVVEPTITPLHIHDTYQPGRIPLYTLRAACGYFDDGQLPEEEGWIDAPGQGFTPDKDRYFAVHAKGDSMLPKIHDGDICVFEWYHAGSRNGEIVLTQSSEYDDAYGGRYTIKRYHSEKIVTDEGWQHTKVELQPLNPDFEPIILDENDDVRTIGIFKCVL